MKLPILQIERFYDLWHPLLEFTNQRLRIYSRKQMESILEFMDPPSENELRVALWTNPWILDEFIKQNPAKYNAEDLATVSEWRNFKYGDFTLVKVVRGLGIFVSHGETHEYFTVYPLYTEFRDLLPDIPMFVRTAILPYGNVLVHDGSMASYSVRFGTGIRKMMDKGYVEAKERGLIRTSFEPRPVLSRDDRMDSAQVTNKSVLRHFKKYLKAEKLSERVIERDLQTVRSFAKFLLNAQAGGLSLRDVSADLLSEFMNSKEGINRLSIVGLRRLVEFYWDSDRISGELSEDLLSALKSFQA